MVSRLALYSTCHWLVFRSWDSFRHCTTGHLGDLCRRYHPEKSCHDRPCHTKLRSSVGCHQYCHHWHLCVVLHLARAGKFPSSVVTSESSNQDNASGSGVLFIRLTISRGNANNFCSSNAVDTLTEVIRLRLEARSARTNNLFLV